MADPSSLNALVLGYLGRGGSGPAITAPEDHPDPYSGAGCHPDVVEHLWRRIGQTLPGDGRRMVHGRPALVHPASGVIIAVGYGTQYAIRVPEHLRDAAAAAGYMPTNTWSDGTTTDVRAELGPDWMFGTYGKDEAEWLQVWG